jgi:pimeloyl-ACP methyl ester carboxylesterase
VDDEFAMLADNASEVGLEWSGPAVVARIAHNLPDGRPLSAIKWGTGSTELVLLHGGAQNAHTWDTVALALDRPVLAIDLPGHGHSGWRDDHRYTPQTLADDVAVLMEALAPDAGALIGMSLGGLTAICLSSMRPDLVRRLGVVDVTPGTDHAKAEPIIEFISGPESFATFDEILGRTIEYNPTRSESSLRRGVLHNALEKPDGSWTWRWDPVRDWEVEEGPDFTDLWGLVEALEMPLTLYRGATSGVVGDEDVEELLRLRPDAEVILVEEAGHSIQGDQPLELAALLEARLDP